MNYYLKFHIQKHYKILKSPFLDKDLKFFQNTKKG